MMFKEKLTAVLYETTTTTTRKPPVIHFPYEERCHVVLTVSYCCFNRHLALTIYGHEHAGIAVDQKLGEGDEVLRSGYV